MYFEYMCVNKVISPEKNKKEKKRKAKEKKKNSSHLSKRFGLP